jgi:ADP-ribose pyrophosphatase YjhB (NUDIX family)
VKREHPLPTVDLIIRKGDEVVLIRRRYPPHGWALPGGFVDIGESLEEAALREGREETSLDIRLVRQFHCYSDPARDPRRHTVTTVFIAEGEGKLRAADDAAEAGVFGRKNLPAPLAFDHAQILEDYFNRRY